MLAQRDGKDGVKRGLRGVWSKVRGRQDASNGGVSSSSIGQRLQVNTTTVTRAPVTPTVPEQTAIAVRNVPTPPASPSSSALAQQSQCLVVAPAAVLTPANHGPVEFTAVVLWEEAYKAITLEFEKQVRQYEEIVRRELPDATVDAGASGEPSTLIRRETLSQLQHTGSQRFDQQLSRLTFGEKEFKVRDKTAEAVKTAQFLTGIIGEGLRNSPEASMIWAGVGISLVLLSNPATVAKANEEGLDFATSRLSRYWELIPTVQRALGRDPDSAVAATTRESFAKLFKAVVEYQIFSVLRFHRGKISMRVRDTLDLDEWRAKREGIEKLVTALQQDISQVLDVDQAQLMRELDNKISWTQEASVQIYGVSRDTNAVAHEVQGTTQEIKALARETSMISQETHEDVQKISSVTENTNDAVARIEQGQDLLLSRFNTDEEDKCRQLFGLQQNDKYASYQWHKSSVADCVDETCQWFLRHEDFRAWLDRKSGPLLVTADPGCGKSVLAKYLVDHELPRHGDATICYFFFKDHVQDRVNRALCALLHQIFDARPGLVHHAMKAFRRDGSGLVDNTPELFRIFETVVVDPSAGRLTLVIDALDECRTEDFKELTQLLNRLFMTRKHNLGPVKCLMTSRPYTAITEGLAMLLGSVSHSIRIPGEQESEQIRVEVELVIRARVDELATTKSLTPQLKHHLLSKLLATTHRTYLWVYLVFDYIYESRFKKTIKGLDVILKTLPQSVNEAYEKLLSKSNDVVFVRRALSMVLAAREPLTVSDLNVAVHVEDAANFSLDDLDLEDDGDFLQRLRDCCGLLLLVHQDKIHFLHQTAREFLIAAQAVKPGNHVACGWHASFYTNEADFVLAESCMAYTLCFDPGKFRPGSHRRFMESDTKLADLNEFPLLRYGATWWSSHFKAAQAAERFENLMMMLGFEGCHSEVYRRLYRFRHLTSYPNCLTDLSLVSEEPVRLRPVGNPMLYFAAMMDHAAVARLLLDNGYPVESDMKFLMTSPLCYAAAEGSFDVAELLLERGADVTPEVASEWDPLGLALQPARSLGNEQDSGTKEVYQLLIERGADVNVTYGEELKTPLIRAVTSLSSDAFRLAAVNLLLEKGAIVDAENIYGNTALFEAVKQGSAELVQRLLKAGADMQHVNKKGQAPVSLATHNDSSLQILMQEDVDVNLPRSTGIPLIVAVNREWEESVRILLSVGADTEVQDEGTGMKPLHFAAQYGFDNILSLLIEAGADVNALNNYGATPLDLALEWDEEEAAEILRRADAQQSLVT